MSISFLQTAHSHVPTRASHTAMPHWLTHLGALGLFSVAVVDSSVIPLPLPGSTDLLFCGWWRTAEIHGCWRPVLLRAASWADTPLGTLAAEAAKLRCATMCRRAFLGAIVGWVERHPHPGGLCSRVASTADSALAICARLRCARRFAQALPCRFRRGAHPALFFRRMARRDLWAQIVRLLSGSLQKWSTPLLCVFMACWWPALSSWNMEDSRAAQDRMQRKIPHCMPRAQSLISYT